ncbi:Flagellar motor switch protein FliG [Posidoniimonas polymericola]|uniref:Flagellar motor switch protein FliG n=1 Tax=Posidoniimonas polymericola TaxID=2528002 RepID=A0A5C5YR48_9BACT|nr:FliG C-terminal domain-containing protein [Posidoniimonas polymericola]TWT77217.1 Flagellar motor switch protein FliG [Posidoniimonas polymericola]
MATATLQSDHSIRKAAVLVRSLDAESVAALLSRLSPAEAKAVRQAVRELDHITDEDRQAVAAALRGGAHEPAEFDSEPAPAAAGVEFAVSGAYSAPSAAAFARPAAPSPIENANPRIDKLGQADPEALIAYLTHEQPATIAVVLSCLPPQRAAEVLSRLPEEARCRAIDRLADMGDIDPDSLDVIASELESWIAQHTQDRRRKEDRRAALQAILLASPAGTRGLLVDRLATRFPELKPQPQPEPIPKPKREPRPEPPQVSVVLPPAPRKPIAPPPEIPFAQLESLDGQQLAAVFGEVDRSVLLVALFGASENLLQRIRGVTTAKQQRALEQSIKRLGPLRLSDISHAQQVVGQAAARVLGPARRAA